MLVVSAGQTTAVQLAYRLNGSALDVSTARPGPDLIRAARELRPHVAVLDGIDARPGTAALEVALLKDSNPGVHIIATSNASSEVDGDVIEQGVFCYLAGWSLDELVRVIERAAAERQSPENAAAINTQPRSIL